MWEENISQILKNDADVQQLSSLTTYFDPKGSSHKVKADLIWSKQFQEEEESRACCDSPERGLRKVDPCLARLLATSARSLGLRVKGGESEGMGEREKEEQKQCEAVAFS